MDTGIHAGMTVFLAWLDLCISARVPAWEWLSRRSCAIYLTTAGAVKHWFPHGSVGTRKKEASHEFQGGLEACLAALLAVAYTVLVTAFGYD
jgi:hypothetical protein